MLTKEQRAILAQRHTDEMQRAYGDWINASIAQARVLEYKDTTLPSDAIGVYNTNIFLTAHGTIECATKCRDDSPYDRIAILDFASYKNPGGGYMRGCVAQDEIVCANTNLYNIISSQKFMAEFYEYNGKHLNNGAYSNRHIYVPSVVVIRPGTYNYFTVDVINCAAPNRTHALRYNNDILPELDKAMTSRIDQVLYTAYKHEVTTLVLGAFGCGVFKNDPDFVAKEFMHLLTTKYKGVFARVVFGVPDASSKNYMAFAKYITKKV